MKGTAWSCRAWSCRWRRLGGAAATALALSACSSPTTPVVQAKVPSTTIGDANPYAVPAHITTAYVQRVLNALDVVDGDATRLIVANRSLVKPALLRLEAIDSKSWFGSVTNVWAGDLASGLKSYRPDPGNQRDLVTNVISANSDCVFVRALTDYSAISIKAQRPVINYIVLRAGPGTSSFNPTPWIVDIEGSNSKGLQPTDPCGGS